MLSDMHTQHLVIETEHSNGVVQLTLNRPHVLNALNQSLYQATATALRKHDKRPSTRIIVLTGSGKRTFCGGMDIKEAMDPGQARCTIRAAGAFIDALLWCNKPVVAAVFGSVTGIGVTMLVHCDRVFSTQDASFQTPFAEVGIVAEFGSSVLFPQLLGLRVTNALLLRGVCVSAVEMESVGAVEVVQSNVRDTVVGYAVKEAAQWSMALASEEQWRAVIQSKRLVREPIRRLVRRAMKAEFLAIDKQIASGDTAKMMKRKVEEIGKRTSRL